MSKDSCCIFRSIKQDTQVLISTENGYTENIGGILNTTKVYLISKTINKLSVSGDVLFILVLFLLPNLDIPKHIKCPPARAAAPYVDASPSIC